MVYDTLRQEGGLVPPNRRLMATAQMRPGSSMQGTPTSGSTGTGGGRAGAPRFEPDVFGKYYLLQRVGVGGMAEVIRAKTVGAGGFQKELVIKRVLPRLARDRVFVRMFVNEAKIAVGLTHPNIAQILELGEIDGTYFMAMELVEGVDLNALAPLFREEGSTLSTDEAVWLVFEALKGLDHAHRRTDPLGRPLNIVHCDISPDNIMVTFDAAVKILDFGIAGIATNLSNRHEGMVMGKVNYLSPEQAVAKNVGHRSDIYSAGVVLYHLVTGDYPYGRFESIEDLVPLVRRTAKYVPATQRNPRIPEDLDVIMRRAVELDPRKRYRDAREFLTDLEEAIYPTPHSTIAEHVRTKVGAAFAEDKNRLARLRANDATVMRILAKRVESAPEQHWRPGSGEQAPLPPPPSEGTPPPREARTTGTTAKRRRIEVPWWHVSFPQILLALVMAVALVGAYEMVRSTLFVRTVLVIESEPSGARAFLDGTALSGVTPIVVDDLFARQSYDVRVELDDHDTWSGTSAGNGESVQRVKARLERRYGPIVVTSVPGGADVLINDELMGKTPLEIERIDLRGPMKLGLRRAGFEMHEEILGHLEAGHELSRQLERRTRRR